MSLAKVNGLFRLTRDMELVNTQGGTIIGKLGLVCSEKYKEKETTLFLDAVCFSKTAEILNQYAGSKGTQIYLSGKLQTESWADNNGQKRSKVSMTIESFDFVSKGNNQTNQGSQQQQSYQQQQTYQQQPQQTYQAPHGNVPVYNEPAPQNQQQGYPRQ